MRSIIDTLPRSGSRLWECSEHFTVLPRSGSCLWECIKHFDALPRSGSLQYTR
jgi:hypothetical protein